MGFAPGQGASPPGFGGGGNQNLMQMLEQMQRMQGGGGQLGSGSPPNPMPDPTGGSMSPQFLQAAAAQAQKPDPSGMMAGGNMAGQLGKPQVPLPQMPPTLPSMPPSLQTPPMQKPMSGSPPNPMTGFPITGQPITPMGGMQHPGLQPYQAQPMDPNAVHLDQVRSAMGAMGLPTEAMSMAKPALQAAQQTPGIVPSIPDNSGAQPYKDPSGGQAGADGVAPKDGQAVPTRPAIRPVTGSPTTATRTGPRGIMSRLGGRVSIDNQGAPPIEQAVSASPFAQRLAGGSRPRLAMKS